MKAVAFGFLGGVLAGLLGAAAWAGIAAATRSESGWMVLVIGSLVGFAVSRGGNRGGGSVRSAAGMFAVLITGVAIVGGKYAVGHAMLPGDDEIVDTFLADFDNEEFVLSYVADDVANDFIDDGRALAWPDGVDPDNATTEADFPADVWSEAEARWAALDSVARDRYRRERRAGVRLVVQATLPEIRVTDAWRFARTFSAVEMVLFALALVAAGGLAGSGRKSRRPPEDVRVDPPGDAELLG